MSSTSASGPALEGRRPAEGPVPATRGELATLWVDGSGAFNVALLCRFRSGPSGPVDAEAVRSALAARARHVPVLRRRLTGGRAPAWVVDESFRADRHVRCTRPLPGTDLLGWSAARVPEPLDRTAPLWRADVVPLDDGDVAVLLVAHHVLADGRKGVAVLRALLDPPADEVPAAGPAAVPVPAPAGSRGRLLRDAVRDLVPRAPVTSLSRPGGAGLSIAVVRTDLAALHTAGGALGATVNDLLLAAVTAGLRDLLLGRCDPVDGLVLRASVPVSSRGGEQPDGMLLVPLPVYEPDRLRRLASITAATVARKARLRAGGGSVLDVLHLPTPLARLAVRGLQRAAGRGINLFVSDVPGPRQSLRLGDARLVDAVPVAPLTAGVPLGVAALSYAGTLAVSVSADAAVTDLGVLRSGMEREFALLTAPASEEEFV